MQEPVFFFQDLGAGAQTQVASHEGKSLCSWAILTTLGEASKDAVVVGT